MLRIVVECHSKETPKWKNDLDKILINSTDNIASTIWAYDDLFDCLHKIIDAFHKQNVEIENWSVSEIPLRENDIILLALSNSLSNSYFQVEYDFNEEIVRPCYIDEHNEPVYCDSIAGCIEYWNKIN